MSSLPTELSTQRPENLIESIRQLGWNALISLEKTKASSNGIIVSSLSITIAIAMLAGAAGPEQKAKLCTKMGISNPADLGNTIASAFQPLQSKGGNGLEIANKVFVDDAVEVRSSYATFLESLTAELASYPDLSKEASTINAWVSKHTHGIINQVVNANLLREAQIILINALAFKGQWLKAFDPKATTKNHTFLSSQTETKTVDMMFLPKHKVLLADHDKYTAIRLPYRKTGPSQPQIYFEAYLPHTSTSLVEVLPILSSEAPPSFKMATLSHLGLPRFKLETSQDITSVLTQLGYPLQGDWSEMIANSTGPPASLVVHKAAIKVDEEGTVAAAVTAVIARKSKPSAPVRSVVFERAFAYAIVDEGGMAYFAGLFT